MNKGVTAPVAGIAGLLLLLGGVADANEVDDRIRRLIPQVREQAAARDSEALVKTLYEIAEVLPGASPDVVAAVNALSRYLADPETSRQTPNALPPAARRFDGPGAVPGTAAPRPAPPAPPPPEPALAPRPVAPTGAPEMPAALVELLRRRGDAALDTGDISGARRFYRRGAEAGCAACAEALADTYDAERLRRMGAVGIKPDPSQAEAWRVRARQLGRDRRPLKQRPATVRQGARPGTPARPPPPDGHYVSIGLETGPRIGVQSGPLCG